MLLGPLDLRHVAAALQDDLLGRRQPALDVAAEAGRDQLVVRGPDEHRRRLPARRGAGRSRRGRTGARGRSRAPRPGRPAGRPASGRCARTRRRRCRPRSGRPGRGRRTATRTARSIRARPERVRQHPELGPQQPHDRVQVAPDEGHGGAQQREAADALGVLEADLDRDAAAHRVADDVGAVDPQLVHDADHRAGEERRAVGGRAACSSRRSPAGRARGRGSRAAERGRGVEERGLRAAEAVQEQHVGALAHRQGRDPQPAGRDVVDAQQRRAAVREPEQALEADREVEVAARVEPALGEGLDAGELALAQLRARSRRRCRS